MKASEWIDRVKTAKGWESDYRVAKELGITRSAVSNYRARESTLDEETSIKLAKELGLNPVGIVLDQLAERTKSEIVRSTLLKEADRLVYYVYLKCCKKNSTPRTFPKDLRAIPMMI